MWQQSWDQLAHGVERPSEDCEWMPLALAEAARLARRKVVMGSGRKSILTRRGEKFSNTVTCGDVKIENRTMAGEISRQTVEDMVWLLLVAYSKM